MWTETHSSFIIHADCVNISSFFFCVLCFFFFIMPGVCVFLIIFCLLEIFPSEFWIEKTKQRRELFHPRHVSHAWNFQCARGLWWLLFFLFSMYDIAGNAKDILWFMQDGQSRTDIGADVWWITMRWKELRSMLKCGERSTTKYYKWYSNFEVVHVKSGVTKLSAPIKINNIHTIL